MTTKQNESKRKYMNKRKETHSEIISIIQLVLRVEVNVQ